MHSRNWFWILGMLIACGCARSESSAPVAQSTPSIQPVVNSKPASGRSVSLLQVPNDGVQPDAAMDANGTLHLVYIQGENAGAANLFYVYQKSGEKSFSAPIQVNSRANSACAAGAVRGGQIAIGKGGRVHVVWNGVGGPEKNEMEMAYARLDDTGKQFEPQRNLMQVTTILDGGGTVAADNDGRVYVAWQAARKGEKGEDKRRPWIAISTDEGATFAEETPAWANDTGACACCGTRAFVDQKDSVYFLYRSATEEVNRDMYLLRSTDHGTAFAGTLLHKWKVPG